MSDESVHAALRSDARLVAIEAPGGCGKTFQGATYARDIAPSLGSGRLLVLTHTHAACSVFDARTRALGSKVEIRTIDSLITLLTSAYHAGLGLPADTATWARQNDEGYDQLAVKAAALLARYPEIAKSLAARYPVVICDEHQDSTGERHAIAMALHASGAHLRIFADPMQAIFRPRAYVGGQPALDWATLTRDADRYEQLDTPHRWNDTSPELGRWILQARGTLKNGGRVDLGGDLPGRVAVVLADNDAHGNLQYRPAHRHRRPIDAFEQASAGNILMLTRYNEAGLSLRPAFNRRIALWEGHNRSALEEFVDDLTAGAGNPAFIGAAIVTFVQACCVGFTAANYVNSFTQDIAEACRRNRRGRPAKVQELARLVIAEPDHRGAAKVVTRLAELRTGDDDFRDIHLDALKEFHEATRIGSYATPDTALAEITHRRTYTRPSPPAKAISTIHKAKGLECDDVIIMPCDARSFPDDQISRRLLYVAMSRAKSRLMFVVPPGNPSPLITQRV
jgi:DNA helicase-2/ATP-dependent DNA helicase PcrA